jgi:hypothetical protein
LNGAPLFDESHLFSFDK